ncbi:MAG: YciI family protein [Sandaracinaceae bacterium]|nr:YciI family protein [Sandaracinaceae bacterium]
MQYLFLLYSPEAGMPPAPTDPAEFEAWMSPWAEYGAALQEAGVMLGANALMPTSTATTVTAASGKTVITDGPFAETKEQLGGYYLVECATLEEAQGWAAKCPGALYGRVEVRPIMDLSGPSR